MRMRFQPFLFSLLTAQTLLCQPVWIRTADLPWAIIGADYHQTIEANVDPRCPGSDSVLSVIGKLPRGLELKGEYLTGVARETGTFRFRIRAANSCAATERAIALVVTGKPILRVYPESLTFQMRAGLGLPPLQSVNLSATWPELAYTVKGDAGWVSAKPHSGVTPPEGSGLASDMVKVQVGATELAPGVYRSTLHFSTWDGANSPEVAVTLIVSP
jgi:hypothetical protein